MRDPEVEVRKAAILTVSALVHRNLDLLAAPLHPENQLNNGFAMDTDSGGECLIDALFPLLLEAMQVSLT